MLNDPSDVWVMGALVVFALLALLAAYAGPEKWTVSIVFLLTPFQPVETKYATVNVLIAYVVFAAYVLRGRITYVPVLAFTILIFLVMLASLSQADPASWRPHIIYLFSIGSAFCLFYVFYNAVIRIRDPKFFVNLLLTLNWLVVFYCGLQLLNTMPWFPIDLRDLPLGLGIEGNRGGGDPRLAGPFGAIGLTAEYLVLSTILIAFVSLYRVSGHSRPSLVVLGTLNLLFLIATGNRGGFLVLVGGGLLFLYMFRDKLSMKTTVNTLIVGALALSVASYVSVNFTKFDRLYDRLEATEFEGGLPDTRATTLRTSWQHITQKPVLGHGPRLQLSNSGDSLFRGHVQITFPHNLYLHLLYTVGVVGLVAYLAFFGSIVRRYWKNASWSSGDELSDGMTKLALLMVVVIAVDQLKIEFLRFQTTDFLQFVFALLAIYLGIGDSKATIVQKTSLSVGGRAALLDA
jgi:O-antigen ligase